MYTVGQTLLPLIVNTYQLYKPRQSAFVFPSAYHASRGEESEWVSEWVSERKKERKRERERVRWRKKVIGHIRDINMIPLTAPLL